MLGLELLVDVPTALCECWGQEVDSQAGTTRRATWRLAGDYPQDQRAPTQELTGRRYFLNTALKDTLSEVGARAQCVDFDIDVFVLAGYFLGHCYFRSVTRSSRGTSSAECSSEVFVLVALNSCVLVATSVDIYFRYGSLFSKQAGLNTDFSRGRWNFVRVQASRPSVLWRRGWVRRRNSCTSHFCEGGRAVHHIFSFNPLFDGYVVVDVLEDMAQQSRREDDATRGFTPPLLSASPLGVL